MAVSQHRALVSWNSGVPISGQILWHALLGAKGDWNCSGGDERCWYLLFSASAGARLWFLLSAHVYSHWRRCCVCLFEGNEQKLRGWADAEHQMIGVSAWDAVCQLETHSKGTLSYVIIWMDATESTKSHFLFGKNTWAADYMQRTVMFLLSICW